MATLVPPVETASPQALDTTAPVTPVPIGPPRLRPVDRLRSLDPHEAARMLAPLALVLLLGWLAVSQAGERKWIDYATEATYLATAAIGLNLLMGYTGLLSLGHAAFFVAGGYAGAVWTAGFGLSPWLGFPVAFAFGALMGTLLGLLCCHLKGFYLTVVTLAFGALLPALVVIFGQMLGGPNGRTVDHPLDVATVPGAQGNVYVGLYLVSAVLLLLTLGGMWNLINSRWGRALCAIRESEIAASASGVEVYRTKIAAFAVSAGIVSMAGVVAAQRFLLVSPSAGSQEQSFRLVAIVTIGGLGTLAGPVLAAFGITFGFGITWVADHFTEYTGLVFGGLSLLGVATAPEGQMGSIRAGLERRRRKLLERGQSVYRRAVPALVPGSDLPVATHQQPRGFPVLEVTGMGRSFGGVVALDSIDLVVGSGTIHALIGPNGSGKTTFINVVTGFYKPSKGRIELNGVDVGDLPTQRRTRVGVARTFQNLQVWRRMTVLDNVRVGMHTQTKAGLVACILGLPRSRREQRRANDRAWGLLHMVGLADHGWDPAGSLSFADLRRLEIARALAGDPDLLLLDEPAAGMTPTEVAGLGHLIRSISDAGVTVLLVEHHMDLVMDISDVVTVLDAGSVIAHGSPAEVRTDPAVLTAYLGRSA